MSNQMKKPVGVNRENFADKVKSYLRHPGSMILMLLVMIASIYHICTAFVLIFNILVMEFRISSRLCSRYIIHQRMHPLYRR